MRDKIESKILDMLIDDAESLAVIHTDLHRLPEFSDLSPKTVLDVLLDMMARGLIRPMSSDDENLIEDEPLLDSMRREYESRRAVSTGYVSDIGPWFTITKQGERVWKTSDPDRRGELPMI